MKKSMKYYAKAKVEIISVECRGSWCLENDVVLKNLGFSDTCYHVLAANDSIASDLRKEASTEYEWCNPFIEKFRITTKRSQ